MRVTLSLQRLYGAGDGRRPQDRTVYIVRVLNWQAEVKVPDPAATLPVGVRIARALQAEAGSQERVSLEIYRRRGQKRYGFFLKLQAPDHGEAAASAVRATVRAFEAEGLPVPTELTVSSVRC